MGNLEKNIYDQETVVADKNKLVILSKSLIKEEEKNHWIQQYFIWLSSHPSFKTNQSNLDIAYFMADSVLGKPQDEFQKEIDKIVDISGLSDMLIRWVTLVAEGMVNGKISEDIPIPFR